MPDKKTLNSMTVVDYGDGTVEIETEQETVSVDTLTKNQVIELRDWLTNWLNEHDGVLVENPVPRTFSEDLRKLINFHSLESRSNTPDFILASFLENVLVDWNHATLSRDRWNGKR